MDLYPFQERCWKQQQQQQQQQQPLMYSWNSMKKVITLAREQISTAPDGPISQIYTFLTFLHTFIFFSTGNYM